MDAAHPFACCPLRIVVVEDDVDTRTTMAELLRSLQHEVAAFPSAEAVWMHAGLESIDLFLVDIGLPGLDGNALCRSLRAVRVNRRAVIVAVSGGAHNGEAQALSAGFDDYILKPLRLSRLLQVLQSVSARHPPACVPLQY